MAREVVELNRAEAMRLLASAIYGRVVFTRDPLPAIRPVNRLMDAGRVIVRTRLTAKASIARKPTTVLVSWWPMRPMTPRPIAAAGLERRGHRGWRPRSPTPSMSPATSACCSRG
jgi:Pyridoxamine 5'-phosphate oxidase